MDLTETVSVEEYQLEVVLGWNLNENAIKDF